jgi:protein-S-isoprenylcysteine O-methyltransferase Ste14
MKKRIKINGVVIIIGIAVIVFFHQQLIRHSPAFSDEALEVVGLSLILLGQLLRVSARGHKAGNSRGGNHLIQDGPYAMVRNPMYLGIILIGLGTVVFVLELWAAVLFGLLFMLRYWQLFKEEEKILSDAFGGKYLAYKNKVPRLVPSLSFISRKEIRSYLSLKPAWFKRELLSIALVLIICLGIEFSEELKVGSLIVFIDRMLPLLGVLILYLMLVLYLVKSDDKKAK